MKKFTELEIVLIACYFIILGISILIVNNLENQLEEQKHINNQLKTEYETLKINYDDLDIDLHQQLKNCEEQLTYSNNKLDVNEDGNINSTDYFITKQKLLNIKEYIMNKDE